MGDSLIAGHFGASLMAHCPSLGLLKLENHAQDGEPLKGVLRHMRTQLESRPAPDILLIEGGANDLLFPYMTEKHFEAWGPFFRKLARHGSIPVKDAEEFRSELKAGLSDAYAAGVKKIIVMTIPCVTENLDNPLNRQREVLNRMIRSVLQEEKREFPPLLCDLGSLFEKALAPLQPGPDWLFSTPADMAAPWTEETVRERRLSLTIDGAHLNTRGAQLAAKELDRVLEALLLKG